LPGAPRRGKRSGSAYIAEHCLEALADDHDFLLAGDVMDEGLIQDWIDYKMNHEYLEVRDGLIPTRWRSTLMSKG